MKLLHSVSHADSSVNRTATREKKHGQGGRPALLRPDPRLPDHFRPFLCFGLQEPRELLRGAAYGHRAFRGKKRSNGKRQFLILF